MSLCLFIQKLCSKQENNKQAVLLILNTSVINITSHFALIYFMLFLHMLHVIVINISTFISNLTNPNKNKMQKRIFRLRKAAARILRFY